jgi:HlyD family secretion protein
VLRDGTPHLARVITGLTDGTFTEVVKGEVKLGDDVIVDVVVSGKAATGPPGAAGAAPRMGRMF